MRIGHGQPRPRRAFTLVEVLATLVLMGIVLPVVMRGMSLSLAAASMARHRAEAAVLAETKLQEVVLFGGTAQLGSGGDFGEQFPEYHWALRSEPHEFNTVQLTLTVLWTERGEERSLDVSTLVYDSDTVAGGTQ